MKEQVQTYLKNLPPPQKEVSERLREIILKTFPKIKETFENGVPWYECLFYIAAQKDHVNLGFCVTGLGKKDMDRFEGKGVYMRHLKFYSLEDVDAQDIVKLLKLVKAQAIPGR